ncbi:MAG: hypothetical protein LBB61_08895 [Treponema sp.]|jgi:hypothetical protein|nr:hypothetical protein [Treponema sp.]
MKRNSFVLFLLVLVCAFSVAQEKIGLNAGAELGFGDVADTAIFGITPQLTYEHSFFEDALDISLEVDYTFNFEDGVPQDIYAEENIGYNLSLNNASTLTFTLHNENNFSTIPEFGDAGDGSIFEPSVTYGVALNAGELAFTAGFPIGYLPDTTFGTYATAGFAFPFGFGFEVTANMAISPEADYSETNVVLYYAADVFSAELEIDADAEFKVYTISPFVEWYVGSFTIWGGVDFGNIGGADSVSVEPYIGVKYSF